jgi:hypothetical protein
MTISTPVERAFKRRDLIAASSGFAVPLCAILAVGVVCCIYVYQNYAGKGQPFAWFDGTSLWPSIAIFLLAALLSVHFIVKIHFQLKQNAAKLTEEFGLNDEVPEESWWLTFKKIYRGWDPPKLVETRVSHPGCEDEKEKKVDIQALWRSYLSRGRFGTRLSRATPMLTLYILALGFLLPLIGQFPIPPMRGNAHFIQCLIISTIVLFLFLTFVVIDAVLLHEGFLKQLAWEKTHWPDRTFKKYKYFNKRERPKNENSLADYWDILLIAKRTEAVGGLIYYPFVILSLLIVARLPYFGNWTWSPVVLVALTLHFSLAIFAAWRLTKTAREYREEVLARLRRRRRQDLMLAQRLPEVTDTMIEEVQSIHQGAFSYLWEQPAIRALLLPSGGFGIATLFQYLPH